MALKKTMMTATGYAATYHVVSDVMVSFKRRVCEALVVGYKDEATRRQAGAQPLWGKRYEWRGRDFCFENGVGAAGLWEQVYEALKRHEDFAGAEDA